VLQVGPAENVVWWPVAPVLDGFGLEWRWHCGLLRSAVGIVCASASGCSRIHIGGQADDDAFGGTHRELLWLHVHLRLPLVLFYGQFRVAEFDRVDACLLLKDEQLEEELLLLESISLPHQIYNGSCTVQLGSQLDQLPMDFFKHT